MPQDDRPVTLDFKPAPPGWRLVFLFDPTDTTGAEYFTEAMPGWLVQRDHTGVFVTAGEQSRDGDVHPAADTGKFWRVVCPDAELPTAEEAQAEWESRRPKPKPKA